MDSSSLPHDQLAKMFPTPPSLEHPSPADGTMEVDHAHVKMEPFSPAPDLTDWWTGGEDFDYTLSSSKFAPLKRLYSDALPALNPPAEFKYKPQRPSRPQTSAVAQTPNSNQSPAGNANRMICQPQQQRPTQQTPLGTPNMKMSPISPMTSVEGGPRSMHQGGHEMASPSAAKDPLLKDSSRYS